MSQLRALSDGVWEATDWLRMAPGIWLPVRSTAVRLRDGGMWIHSPIRFTDETATEISALGPVRWLVAPNAFHHMRVAAARARWPDARLVSSDGCKTKQPGWERAEWLDSFDLREWKGEIRALKLAGAERLDEWEFLHEPSGTLILTDVAFNLHEFRGALSGLMFRATGCFCRLSQSRMVRGWVRDRAAFAASGRELLAWDADRLVVGHGQNCDPYDREQLRTGLSWMLSR